MKKILAALALLPCLVFGQTNYGSPVDTTTLMGQGSSVGTSAQSNYATPPTSVPSGLGSFSDPNAATQNVGTERTQGGLTSFGQTAMAQCANYVPGKNALLDQQCASVNFLANNCITANSAQQSIIGSHSSASTNGVNCSGSYGAGSVANSPYTAVNGVTNATANGSAAQILALGNIYNSANAASPESCNVQEAVTTPAQFTTYQCVKSTTTNQVSCNQTLATTVITNKQTAQTSYSCSGGTINGQYCQATATNPAPVQYSCAAGYTLNGTSCSQTITNNATPNYSCPSGYTLNGSSCSQTITNNATPNYACPSGYTLNGSNCNGVNNISIPATLASYSCPAGQTLSGSSCLQTLTQSASIANYSCPSGYTLSGSSCSKTLSQSATIASYGCPAGQSISGSSCIATNSTSAAANVSYSCPAGQVLSGSSCIATSTTAATPSYTCPGGPGLTFQSLNGATASCSYSKTYSATPTYYCDPVYGGQYEGEISWIQGTLVLWPTLECSTSPDYPPDAIYYPASVIYSCNGSDPVNGSSCSTNVTTSATLSSYICSAGSTLSGSSCIKSSSTAAYTTYSCNSGGVLSGSQCTYTTTTTSAAAPNYSCPSGYTLSGSSCSENLSQAATPNYSCPSGYSLSGSVCSQTNTFSATPNYSCAVGSTLSGTNCISQQQVVSPATIANYSCPSGYTLNGSSCSLTLTQSATITSYLCPAGYTLNGSSCSEVITQVATTTYSCPAGSTLSGSGANSICTTVTTTPATVNYSCADGSAPQSGMCLIFSVSSLWQDNCSAYETSAGSKLGAPQ